MTVRYQTLPSVTMSSQKLSSSYSRDLSKRSSFSSERYSRALNDYSYSTYKKPNIYSRPSVKYSSKDFIHLDSCESYNPSSVVRRGRSESITRLPSTNRFGSIERSKIGSTGLKSIIGDKEISSNVITRRFSSNSIERPSAYSSNQTYTDMKSSYSTNTKSTDLTEKLRSVKIKDQDIGSTFDKQASDSVAAKVFRSSNLDTNDNYSTDRRSSTRTQPSSSAGLIGLYNLGNTCFMNSVLQCLSHCSPLRRYIRSGRWQADQNTNRSMNGALMRAYADLVDKMWSSSGSSISPSDFKQKIGHFANRFNGYQQHDSHEFLRYLLDGIHEDVNRVNHPPKMSNRRNIPDDLVPEEKAFAYWEEWKKLSDSSVQDIFMGQLRSTIVCDTCKRSSVTFDPMWDISLSISDRSPSITSCLRFFVQEEVLNGSVKFKCSHCKDFRCCRKHLMFQRLPRVLIIHLKRFSVERHCSKLSTRVSFDETLDMTPFVSPMETKCNYRLFAVSNHMGSCYSGHYTALARHSEKLTWHLFDDSRVTETNLPSSSSEAYLLFYELQES